MSNMKLCIITNGARAIIPRLDDAQAGALAKAIVAHFDGEPFELPHTLQLVWGCIEGELVAAYGRLDDLRAKRAEAGRKHRGNQYTKRNKLKQMEQNGTNGTKENKIEENKIEENRIDIKKKIQKEKAAADAAIALAGDECSRDDSTKGNGDPPTQPQPTARARPQPKRPTTAHPDFTRFWDAYPRRVGKGAAARAFDKARKAPEWPGIDAVVAAIDAVRDSDQWTRDHGAYIPHPATWLNQMRWLDGDGGVGNTAVMEPVKVF